MNILEFKVNQKTCRIYRSVFPPVESNMYVLIEDNEAIVVDSNISQDVLDLMREQGVKKVHLFLTHEHYDHSHGVCWFKENFYTVLYCHEECHGKLSTNKMCSPKFVAFTISANDKKYGFKQYEEFKNSVKDYVLEPDLLLHDCQIINIAGHKISIIHVPGHTPGSCLYKFDDNLVFSGDTMIKGQKIITGFRGGNLIELKHVTLPKLKALSDDIWVLPGHGDHFQKKEFDFDIYDV